MEDEDFEDVGSDGDVDVEDIKEPPTPKASDIPKGAVCLPEKAIHVFDLRYLRSRKPLQPSVQGSSLPQKPPSIQLPKPLGV